MYKDLKWIRLVPDQPGKGGIKKGIHSFQTASVNDTWFVNGFHVWRGSWRRDSDTAVIGGTTDDPATVNNYSIHAYAYPDLTDPSAASTVTLLGHNYLLTSPRTQRYWDFTNGAVRETHTGNAVPATFLDIGGRCFIFDGAREGFIADDREPAIHAQANQNLGIEAPKQVLGGGAFGGTAPAFVSNTLSVCTAAYAHYTAAVPASSYINSPNPDSQIGTIVIADFIRIFKLCPNYPNYSGTLANFTGAVVANGLSSNSVTFAAPGTVSCANGAEYVVLAGGAWPANQAYAGMMINFAGKSYVIRGSAETTDLNGNPKVANAAHLSILGVYDGDTIPAPGVPYTITGCQLLVGGYSTLQTTNTAASMNGYAQSTLSSLTLVGIEKTVGFVGNLSWGTDNGPQYAYAFYDPETGHISNLSPLYRTPNTGAPVANVTPTFYVDPGMISAAADGAGGYSPPIAGTDAARFSHIVFFRTLSAGGATFFPIGSLQPYIGKVHPGLPSTRGSWNPDWRGLPNAYCNMPQAASTTPNYWYDYSTDDDLLLTAGLIGPQYTNDKPIVTLRGGIEQPGYPYAAANWDGRLWLINTQEPDKVVFSCDSVQCPFGVPEESFDPTNFLRIPSVDGRVKGMHVAGELLIITTERWTYTVVGNNESNYRLVRISTQMPGVGTYQMDDMTGSVEGYPSLVYFVGRDKLIYEWMPGTQATPISDALGSVIEDYLKLSPYENIRVHCASVAQRRFVAISFGATQPYIFDIDKRIWTEGSFDNGWQSSGIWSFATSYAPIDISIAGVGFATSDLVNEIAATPSPTNHVQLRAWARDETPQTIFTGQAPEITTFPMNFDGKKTRKQLCYVNLHVTGGTWNAMTIVNESSIGSPTPKIYTVTGVSTYVDPLYSVYDASPLPVDGANCEDLVVLQAAFGTPDGSPPTGYRFQISVIPTANEPSPLDPLTPGIQERVLAIDIGYQNYSEEGEVDP